MHVCRPPLSLSLQSAVWGAFFRVPFIVVADSDLYLAGQLQVRAGTASYVYMLASYVCLLCMPRLTICR